jgi:hypothetical protein
MIDENLMWFPDPDLYIGRDHADYTQTVAGLSLERVVELVQARANEDGEWAIANGRVGEDNRNEPKMRKMMAFAADAKNIEQALDYIYKAQTEKTSTVDDVCRELAKASQWAASLPG